MESCSAAIDGVLVEDNQKVFDQQLSGWLTKFGLQAVAKVRKRRKESYRGGSIITAFHSLIFPFALVVRLFITLLLFFFFGFPENRFVSMKIQLTGWRDSIVETLEMTGLSQRFELLSCPKSSIMFKHWNLSFLRSFCFCCPVCVEQDAEAVAHGTQDPRHEGGDKVFFHGRDHAACCQVHPYDDPLFQCRSHKGHILQGLVQPRKDCWQDGLLWLHSPHF